LRHRRPVIGFGEAMRKAADTQLKGVEPAEALEAGE
jgi:hypothetical protein